MRNIFVVIALILSYLTKKRTLQYGTSSRAEKTIFPHTRTTVRTYFFIFNDRSIFTSKTRPPGKTPVSVIFDAVSRIKVL